MEEADFVSPSIAKIARIYPNTCDPAVPLNAFPGRKLKGRKPNREPIKMIHRTVTI
jgi:hypothetical protein